MKSPLSFKYLSNDLPAAIVVFLVAVPLCLGIALASGTSLLSGIIAGIVGGTVVTLFSNSSLGVSGPAAGLVAIVIAAIEQLGSFETFLLAVVISGIFQLLLGFLKAGSIGYFFPSSVIKGMLSGIGLIIILKQIPHALGDDKDPEGEMAYQQPDGETTFSEIFKAFTDVFEGLNVNWGPAVAALVAFTILIIWQQDLIKKQPWALWIQGPLVAVISGILLNLGFKGIPQLEIAPEHLVSLPIFDSWAAFSNEMKFPNFAELFNPAVYSTAITLAIVGSMESLLCAEATDKLDPHKRTTNLNQELKAQGMGNIAAGLLGGLPVTQVIVRSSANIQSGGRSKTAAFLHGVFLLLAVLTIPFLLNLIPLASLAAILVMVGYKLANPTVFKQMWRQGYKQFIPFVVTIVAILLSDLLVGITIGMAVAIFYILRNNYRLPFTEIKEGDRIHLQLSEDLSFLNKSALKEYLSKVPAQSHLLIDASRTAHIDPDILDIFEDFKAYAKFKEIRWEWFGLDREGESLAELKQIQPLELEAD
ncbi:SulP family inorganic anion transporter [Saprospira sp. CCB-QB6]|uniref:SulP family inorganic anion transporter n=1 Tax=Saprospira sp. CCB-QB6 TaxID=3023936 RepID=UPI00234B4958|nr:SulP family inorganic anion transporter [Saprospira sp. CCB-QB6]WCL82384.1 SulP family inorganic anion transporter [Saprospira sp. CCB-QB6]